MIWGPRIVKNWLVLSVWPVYLAGCVLHVEMTSLFKSKLNGPWYTLYNHIMVIELSRGQFGLKSYVWFQNRPSMYRKFNLKSQVWFIMVIELSGVQFGLKSYAWYQNWRSVQRKFDLEIYRKYDFRPKLHDPKFNYHFIRSILKLHKFAKQWLFCLSFSCNVIG